MRKYLCFIGFCDIQRLLHLKLLKNNMKKLSMFFTCELILIKNVCQMSQTENAFFAK